MYTDGETFYYRTDRPNRVPNRSRGNADGPLAASPDRRERSGEELSERLARLESRAQQMESSLTQLMEAVQRLVTREGAGLATRAAVRAAAVREPEAEAEGEPAEAPAAGGDRAGRDQGVKVSVYADGSATAILGQVRVDHEPV